MSCLKVREAAKRDLINIAHYTQQRWGKKQRNSYLKQFDEVFKLLTGDPFLGRSCDYIRKGYRKLPLLSHVIYYRINKDNCVDIIRILHQRMDVTNDKF